MGKYQFAEEHKDAVLTVRHFKKPITKDNLTDEKAEIILKKYPHLAHNIEEKAKAKVKAKKSKKADSGNLKNVQNKEDKSTPEERIEAVKAVTTIEELTELAKGERVAAVKAAIREKTLELKQKD